MLDRRSIKWIQILRIWKPELRKEWDWGRNKGAEAIRVEEITEDQGWEYEKGQGLDVNQKVIVRRNGRVRIWYKLQREAKDAFKMFTVSSRKNWSSWYLKLSKCIFYESLEELKRTWQIKHKLSNRYLVSLEKKYEKYTRKSDSVSFRWFVGALY